LSDPVFLRLQTLVAGRFSLEREIGRGGMGIVYLARDVALERPVAIKVLAPSSAARHDMRARFLREARIAAQCSLPRIVTVFFGSVIALSLTVACSQGGDPARDTLRDAAHAPITDALTGPGTREGTWRGAEAHSTWRATLDGPRVTQIDEIALYTDSTRAMRQFRFDTNGALASVREERSQKVYGSKVTPDTVNTLIELELRADSVVRSAKRVNGADRVLQPYEVDNVRAHAAELLKIARAGTTMESKP
jgi:hypothetical protein